MQDTKPINWPRIIMDSREIAAAQRVYPRASPTGHTTGQNVVADGGEASEPLAAVYVGYDPAAGYKPHVVCVLTPSGRGDLHVSSVT